MPEDEVALRVLYSKVAFDDIGLTWGKSRGSVYHGGERRLKSLIDEGPVEVFEVRVGCDSEGRVASTIRYDVNVASSASASASASSSSGEDSGSDTKEGVEAEMARLGLPCAFGKKQPERSEKKKTKKMEGESDKRRNHNVWVQAFDESTGFYYYYNTALGVSQWRVPKDGYDAMPGGHLLGEVAPLLGDDQSEKMSTVMGDGVPMSEMFDPPPCPSSGPWREKHSLYAGKHQGCTPRPETSGIHDDGIPDVPKASKHTRFASDTSDNDDDDAQETRKQPRRRLVQYGSTKVLHKYWLQRYSLFSLFDNGIILDEEGWYSATPEIIAWHHATTIVRTHGSGCVVVDAFGGVGGNAIQLALAGCRVIAIELCSKRAEIIRNNAQVYGVEHEIDIMCGDFMALGPCLDNVDVVLLSPPWGGPMYSNQTRFDVQEMGGAAELSFSRLLNTCFGRMACTSAVFWLPRNSHCEQIGIQVASCDSIPDMYRNQCHIELATINNVDKAVTVYVGKCSQNTCK